MPQYTSGSCTVRFVIQEGALVRRRCRRSPRHHHYQKRQSTWTRPSTTERHSSVSSAVITTPAYSQRSSPAASPWYPSHQTSPWLPSASSPPCLRSIRRAIIISRTRRGCCSDGMESGIGRGSRDTRLVGVDIRLRLWFSCKYGHCRCLGRE